MDKGKHTIMDNDLEYKHLFPVSLEVTQGCQYRWCGCGESKTQPLCDKDNCEGKSITYIAEMNEEVTFCNCKKTKNPPWCDGSHGRLLLEVILNKRSKC